MIEVDLVTGNATIVAPEVPRGYLLNLSVTHADPLRPMALSPEGGLLLSDDGGATWRAVLN